MKTLLCFALLITMGAACSRGGPNPQSDAAPGADSVPKDTKELGETPPVVAGQSTAAEEKRSAPFGEEACQNSTQAANNGQIEKAASLYQACLKGGQTAATAKASIARNAPAVAQQAAFRNDCPRARSIAAAAISVGVQVAVPGRCAGPAETGTSTATPSPSSSRPPPVRFKR